MENQNTKPKTKKKTAVPKTEEINWHAEYVKLEAENKKLEEYCYEYSNDIENLMKKNDDLSFENEYLRVKLNQLQEKPKSFWSKLTSWI